MSRTKKDFEKYIREVVDNYIPILFLQSHDISIMFGDKTEYFEMSFKYPYLNERIYYSESAYKDWRDGEDLKSCIVHELCHAITDPLFSKAIQRYVSEKEISSERERLTDYICNIVLNFDNNIGGVPR